MRFLRTVATASLLLTPCAVGAQDAVDTDPPAHVSFVDGTAVIERDGKVDTAPANMPLLAGDRVRTETGRVEILFADGSTLHLDNFTTVDFQSDELVRVLDGRVRLTIAGRQRDVGYRLDGAGAWAQISQPGEYRFALLRRDGQLEVELAVLRGSAELVNDDGRTQLRAGERAWARAGVAPSYAYVFNSASWDAFDRWSEARRDQRLGLSAQYLPEPVHAYSRDFDRYGSWSHEPTYGYVWYPTVAVGWRPYYYGRWASLRPYGWVWVGTDRWSWATHHYGRWGISAGRWFWIPGRSWGAAWVSWGYSSDYVSWCPLGWNNRPVFQIVNVRGYDPWRAWTVVRRSHFGHDYVHRRVVSAHLLNSRARSNWEFRDRGPDLRGYAVPRGDAPIRRVGRAVPRAGSGSAPVYTNRPTGDSRVDSNGRRIEVGEGRPGRAVPDGRSRAVPRDGADVPRMMPERGVRSAPAIRSGPLERSDGAERQPESVNRDPRSRAIPRGDAGEAGRAAGPRASGSRTSSPAIRSGTESADSPSRPRAVPRGSENRDERPPNSRPDDASYSPYPRRAPASPPRPVEAAGERSEPQRYPGVRDPGVRAIPRGSPGDGALSAPSRMPAERRGPDGPPAGGRVAPRSEPQARPSPMPEQRMERRPPSRGDSPAAAPSERSAPSRARPSGGRGGARRGEE